MNTVIAQTFGNAASAYLQRAEVQHYSAERLAQLFNERCNPRKTHHERPRDVLEVGCGPRPLWDLVRSACSEGVCVATDISKSMLQQVEGTEGLALKIMDAERPDFERRSMDALVSNFAFQWTKKPIDAILECQRCVKLGGLIAVALPIQGSFWQWNRLCKDNDVPSGIWEYPSFDQFRLAFRDLSLMLDPVRVQYANVGAFLHAMKDIGAGTPREGHVPIAPAQMRKLLGEPDRPFPVTYNILYITGRVCDL